MSTQEAIALYRAEKAAATSRGVNLAARTRPPEIHSRRIRLVNMHDGSAWIRPDAFQVTHAGEI